MSEENMELEQVEAEVVEEGAKAVTMDEIPEAPKAPEPDFSGSNADGFASNAQTAGTSYEQSVYSEKSSKVFGIISLVLGIFSVICCCTCWGGVIAGVGSIIFGIVSLKNEPEAKTLATIGIVCGGVGTVLGLVGVIFSSTVDNAANLVETFDIDPEIIEKIENL